MQHTTKLIAATIVALVFVDRISTTSAVTTIDPTAATPFEIPTQREITSEPDFTFADESMHMRHADGSLSQTWLQPELQNRLQAFIADNGNPIAASVVVDIKSGHILSLAQGRAPSQWGSEAHSALWTKFPAASLFKTVVAAAALELTDTEPDEMFRLDGGCGSQDIGANANWMRDSYLTTQHGMTLRRAFGHSCNSFFAKLAINQLGIGSITRYAHLLGWDRKLPIDVDVEPSRMLPPSVTNSTTHTVGRFAAGFGHVGISAIHAAWLASAIANGGVARPLYLFRGARATLPVGKDKLLAPATAKSLLRVMHATVEGGTAANVFRRGKYRLIANQVGGKTGTLTGKTPAGLTTLFFGAYPIDNPRIAVATVVVLEDRWHIKASHLAAEAMYNWHQINRQNPGISAAAASGDSQTTVK